MTSFYGFIPSETLKQLIDEIDSKLNANEPLYPTRDKIALTVTDEIIKSTITDLIHAFPPSDKRETAEKLAGYIRSTVNVLLKQLLEKTPNDKILDTVRFLHNSLFIDPQGEQRFGAPLPDHVVDHFKQLYLRTHQGEIQTSKPDLNKHFKESTIHILDYFLGDFVHTLNLGFIKRKAADLAHGAINKSVSIAIDFLIPRLTDAEVKAVTSYYNNILFKLD